MISFLPQVTVGSRDGVQVGILEYTIDPTIIIAVSVVGGSMLICIVLMILIICCVCCCYKRNKMKAVAHAIELQERMKREREMTLKKQEELEQQVENMASQVVVVHSQMKGTGWCIVTFSSVLCNSGCPIGQYAMAV